MSQRVRTRQQPNDVLYSANNQVSENLSRGMVYREIALRLQGQLTVSAANNTAANTQRGDEWGVCKKIEIVANGTDVIRSIDGNALWWMNYFMFGRPPRVTPAIGDGTTLNPSFDSVLILPIWTPRSVRPLDTALDSKELSGLEIRVTWGDHTNINSAATGFTAAPTVQAYSLESFNISGPFSQLRVRPIIETITATTDRFQIQLPVGNVYRGFLINTTDADVDQGDILNRFKLVSGTTVFADVHAGSDVLADWYGLRNGVQEVFDSVGGQYLDLRRGVPNNIEGWYFYDHVTDGFNTEGIDTLGFSEFDIEADVTVGAGTTRIAIYPLEIVPIRSGPNNA